MMLPMLLISFHNIQNGKILEICVGTTPVGEKEAKGKGKGKGGEHYINSAYKKCPSSLGKDCRWTSSAWVVNHWVMNQMLTLRALEPMELSNYKSHVSKFFSRRLIKCMGRSTDVHWWVLKYTWSQAVAMLDSYLHCAPDLSVQPGMPRWSSLGTQHGSTAAHSAGRPQSHCSPASTIVFPQYVPLVCSTDEEFSI